MVGTYKNQNRGIYKILNIENGKFYIGSTIHYFGHRWSTHKWELNSNRHKNQYLQNSWNKYGKEKFVFMEQEVLNDLTDINKLREREQYWINNLNPEYNLSNVALYGEMTTLGKWNMITKQGNKCHVITPEGIELCGYNYSAICELYPDLNRGSLRALCIGKLHTVKGWKGSNILQDGSTPFLHTKKKYQNYKYHLVSPQGIHICTQDLKQFCIDNDLSYSHMCNVANPNNKRRHHKYWVIAIISDNYIEPIKHNIKKDKLIQKKNQGESKCKYIYTFISPQNKKYIITGSLTQFCKDNKLTPSKVNAVCRKEQSHTKGWVISRELKHTQ